MMQSPAKMCISTQSLLILHRINIVAETQMCGHFKISAPFHMFTKACCDLLTWYFFHSSRSLLTGSLTTCIYVLPSSFPLPIFLVPISRVSTYMEKTANLSKM
uniref:Uncharacterized protein n=1 Tax=Micrurus lemniscatus lemniscatus TaxID=129467 RepID=A0A2D4HY78_MICLE